MPGEHGDPPVISALESRYGIPNMSWLTRIAMSGALVVTEGDF